MATARISKSAAAKKAQKWRDDGPKCSNCKHFTSEIDEKSSYYTIEKKIRCSAGGFSTKKMAWCTDHEWKNKK
ncbi:MAG: hypothetical protein RBT11_19835 [Desulfobacterales bacterium]|jgi:hypothetical protein|nr:hypothetical protein [Desulfobacterales bacterium]